MSKHPEQALSVVIFSACYAVAGLTLGGMWLLREEQSEQEKRPLKMEQAAKRVIVGMPLLAIVASLVAQEKPQLGLAVWIALPFLGLSLKKKHESKQRENEG